MFTWAKEILQYLSWGILNQHWITNPADTWYFYVYIIAGIFMLQGHHKYKKNFKHTTQNATGKKWFIFSFKTNMTFNNITSVINCVVSNDVSELRSKHQITECNTWLGSYSAPSLWSRVATPRIQPTDYYIQDM